MRGTKTTTKSRTAPRSGVEVEITRALKRLNQVVDGPSDLEMLRVAVFKVVGSKLEEIGQLLRAFAPEIPDLPPARVAIDSPPQAARAPMTMENIQQEIAAADRGAAPATDSQAPPCQWCGEPSVYKTIRGMVLCTAHRPQGIRDDQGDKFTQLMKRGFGNTGSSNGEVIHVDVPAET